MESEHPWVGREQRLERDALDVVGGQYARLEEAPQLGDGGGAAQEGQLRVDATILISHQL